MIFRIRQAFSCDLHTLFEHMTLFRERGWRFWTLPGWDGKLEPELSSISILSSWMNALYLLKWSSFKVKSSLWWLRCGALQESHCHLSYLLHKKWRSNPGLGWGNWTKQSSKFKCLESCLRRMLKLRIDRSIICIASVNGSVVQSEAYSVSFDIHHFVEPISPQWLAREPLCQRPGWRAKLSVSSSTVSRVFTNWPSKIDSKRTFWVLALCQRESDARQFTLSETNENEDRVTKDDAKSVINSLTNSRNPQVKTWWTEIWLTLAYLADCLVLVCFFI